MFAVRAALDVKSLKLIPSFMIFPKHDNQLILFNLNYNLFVYGPKHGFNK